MVKGQHEYHPLVKYGTVGVYTFPSFFQPSEATKSVEGSSAPAGAPTTVVDPDVRRARVLQYFTSRCHFPVGPSVSGQATGTESSGALLGAESLGASLPQVSGAESLLGAGWPNVSGEASSSASLPKVSGAESSGASGLRCRVLRCIVAAGVRCHVLRCVVAEGLRCIVAAGVRCHVLRCVVAEGLRCIVAAGLRCHVLTGASLPPSSGAMSPGAVLPEVSGAISSFRRAAASGAMPSGVMCSGAALPQVSGATLPPTVGVPTTDPFELNLPDLFGGEEPDEVASPVAVSPQEDRASSESNVKWDQQWQDQPLVSVLMVEIPSLWCFLLSMPLSLLKRSCRW